MGLSATEFAAETGINANSLRHWGWRVNADQRRAGCKSTAMEDESLQWVGATAPAAPNAPAAEKLELVLASGLVVRVPPGFESEALRRLLAVVG